MSTEVGSTNPIVKAIIAGTAPRPAQLAAARGALPIPQSDLLEALVHLVNSEDAEIQTQAKETLNSQEIETLRTLARASDTSPKILHYFLTKEHTPAEIQEAILTNLNISDDAIISFVRSTRNGSLLELVAVNQQRLIRSPQIIDAIINNPFRTGEAERRASETKREFFEKERGAQQIANELRAQGNEAAAEFIENSDLSTQISSDGKDGGMSVEDALLIAKHIEIPDSETDDSWLSLEYIEDIFEETEEQRQAILHKIIGEMRADNDDLSSERIGLITRIIQMSMKDRIKLAAKGDREARNILIRDPNRVVAQAVIQNPRITEQEVEKIASMRSAPEDVLRVIASKRAWARNYPIILSLARNPRVPIANVLGILPRLQAHDLAQLSKSRNVSEAVRKQADRLAKARRK